MAADAELPDLPASPPTGTGLEADAAAAATVLAHGAAGAQGGHGPVHTHCENCGTRLEGPFCHRCGQHDFEFHRSFWHVLLEALESFFHFEGKFFRNIVTLLFRPGRLTADFNAGRRAAQMPPFRLYVFVSVVFFFWFFLGGETQVAPLQLDQPAAVASPEPESGRKAADATRVVRDQPAPAGAASEPLSELASAATGSKPVVIAGANAQRIELEGSEDSAFVRWLESTVNRMAEPDYRMKLADAFVHSVPRLLLFCLPLFALYTRLLFRRSGLVYLQHLVLALHFHSFVYLWILFRDGWTFLAGFLSTALAAFLWHACMLWATAYPVLMLRELFRNNWPRTIGKTLALASAYLLTIAFAFVGALLVVIAAL